MLPIRFKVSVVIRFLPLAFVATTSLASAQTCSEFEQTVYELIWDAQAFQHSEKFREYGFSKAGPSNGWLDRWTAVRDMDNSLHLDFLRKYNYVPGDLYSVATAYLFGSVDDFYRDLEEQFLKAPDCK